MKSIAKIVLGFVLGILVCALIPLGTLALGLVNVGADTPPSIVERTLAPWAVDQSVEKRAPKEANPYAADPAAAAAGLELYRGSCILCHGAPGVKSAAWYKGLNPEPPYLAEHMDLPDGEYFWIIKHGIRMTGMPAFGHMFSDEQIWKLAAFLRHLPSLTPQEQESLGKS